MTSDIMAVAVDNPRVYDRGGRVYLDTEHPDLGGVPLVSTVEILDFLHSPIVRRESDDVISHALANCGTEDIATLQKVAEALSKRGGEWLAANIDGAVNVAKRLVRGPLVVKVVAIGDGKAFYANGILLHTDGSRAAVPITGLDEESTAIWRIVQVIERYPGATHKRLQHEADRLTGLWNANHELKDLVPLYIGDIHVDDGGSSLRIRFTGYPSRFFNEDYTVQDPESDYLYNVGAAICKEMLSLEGRSAERLQKLVESMAIEWNDSHDLSRLEGMFSASLRGELDLHRSDDYLKLSCDSCVAPVTVSAGPRLSGRLYPSTRAEAAQTPEAEESPPKGIEDAAWRVAGSQLTKLVREPLVGVLSRHIAPGDAVVRARLVEFLQTPIGTAILSAGLGMVPQIPERLAHELRVQAMSIAGDEIADLITEPFCGVISLYLSDASVVHKKQEISDEARIHCHEA